MKKIINSLTSEKNYPVFMPILSIVLAFAVASVVLLLTGLSPLSALKGIFKGITGMDLSKIGQKGFFNARILGEYGVGLMPIILTGLSVAFAFRTGLFNIGAEGQLMMGAVASIYVAFFLSLPKFIHLPLALFAGFVAGALWGMIPGLLKAKFKVHEVVVCILANHVALSLSNELMRKVPGFANIKTPSIPETASLKSDFLSSITGNSRFHYGFIIVIAAIIIFYYIIEKTSFGYELRAVGFNSEAARYAGIKVNKSIVLSMMISGGFAGLAGTMMTLGTFGFGRLLGSFEGAGFTGIAVSLVGGNTAFGTFFSSLIFGGLENSGRLLQVSKIPLEITMIISSLIILFIAMKEGFKDVLQGFSKEYFTQEDLEKIANNSSAISAKKGGNKND